MHKKITKTAIANRKRIDVLYKNISSYIHSARCNVLRTVDTEQVKAYWLIGRDIVEEEQKGAGRAEYGAELIKLLSQRLTKEFGKGFGIATLENARKFYLVYTRRKSYAPRRELVRYSDKRKSYAVRSQFDESQFNPNFSWTHYRALMRESRENARAFYEYEAAKNCWSGRELERQMGSLLFERLAKSKDKKGLIKLACKGQEVIKPEDVIKEPIVLEFLGLPESHKLVESKLEDALISSLQNFLLELGSGFAFVGRQKRLMLDGDHFYADLVMYHTVLHAYVIIDLKTQPLTHADLGQMQLYVNYFDMEIKTEKDSPTIGLVLCTKQNKKMVRYFLGDKTKNIFASKYQFHLPTEKELEAELKRGIKDFKYRLQQQKE